MASFAARAHSGSCTACCLPNSQVLFCRDAPQIVSVNCCQQHNCCVVVRKELEGKNEFFLEEGNLSGRKLPIAGLCFGPFVYIK